MADTYDLVIVGGGIGGAALATVMARAGASCLVLERTTEFPDRTRGEWIAPWGVTEARRLDLEDVLRSARGHTIQRHVTFEPETPPAKAEAEAIDLSIMAPDVAGPLTQRHPDACQALFDAAGKAGAVTHRGVEDIVLGEVVEPGRREVSYDLDGARHAATARLVVAADGRNSVIVRQLGWTRHKDEPHHLFSGLLVDDAGGFPADIQVIGTTEDTHYLAFPQGDGRIRLYLGFPIADRHRFAGEGGTRRFLDAFATPSLPYADAIVDATPISPHAVYANEDSWLDSPVGDHVVAIGDAAGWNDPIIGQGLSITLRDVRVVTDLLRSTDAWSAELLAPYAEERAERMRRLRIAGRASSVLNNEFGPEAVERRIRARERMAADPMLMLLVAAVFVGPDVVPAESFSQETWDAVFG
jgi:2-polyprenyl-6-methoxyphenol hydroxylase-like FAD-dependent oxidoreductase